MVLLIGEDFSGIVDKGKVVLGRGVKSCLTGFGCYYLRMSSSRVCSNLFLDRDSS